MIKIHETLLTYFGFAAFRPQQEEIIESVLSGRDVLALLPTGGGKSLCYQVPALSREGLCLVVSPLIALMKDQVDHLRKKNIAAFSIHSGLSFIEVKQTLKAASESNCKFLYVSPERLHTRLFQEWLSALNVQLIAVDEAHCISQWGYDFRPTYLKIAEIRALLPGIPVIALTASATTDVQKDICEKLLFKDGAIFRQSFAKPNLSFSCFQLASKYPKLKDILEKVNGSALVYCRNRRRTKDIAQLLQADNISASFYHAGLSTEERTERQHDWIHNKTRVMVCTNAFGMGIDKPDVRTVVHMDVPDCQENYYQEAGRAGRDGIKAYAVLLYNNRELRDMELLADQKYPAITDIRHIYQSLCNYLQLPEGIGQDEYYDFDIHEFCKRWNLEAVPVMNVMKTLEQAGYISFQESVFTTSKAAFICERDYLFQFEKVHNKLEPLIKCLLRSYDGIFTNTVSIFEHRLAKILRQEPIEIIRQLQLLVLHKIINYQPRKERPQIYFLYNRVHKNELVIDQKSYLKRKEGFEERVRGITAFTTNIIECRSELLRKYFGEKQTEPCGICDVCLQKKWKGPNKTALQTIAEELKKILSTPKKIEEIHSRLPQINRVSLRSSIDYLISEEIVEYNLEGEFCLRK